jgi:hypothetical protein
MRIRSTAVVPFVPVRNCIAVGIAPATTGASTKNRTRLGPFTQFVPSKPAAYTFPRMSPLTTAVPARLFLRIISDPFASLLVCSLMMPRDPTAIDEVETCTLASGAVVPTPTLLVVVVLVPVVVHCADASSG